MASVGPWGWHLPLHLKWSLTIALSAGVYFELTDEEQDYWVDMGAVLGWGFSMYGLWAPPVVNMAIMARVGLAVGGIVAPAAPVIAVTAAALVTGDIISHAIDPESGRKNFRDFVDPFQLAEMPGRIAFTAETIYEHKIEEPLVAVADWYVAQVDEGIGYVNDTYDSATNWIIENNRFLTGPYLPF